MIRLSVVIGSVVILLSGFPIEARFGQENPAALNRIRNCNSGGDGTVNGKLADFAGAGIRSLLAAADACAQQDLADNIIDFSRANNLPQACVQAAIDLARAERNVNPFARQNPCSDICGRLARNAQLRGSVQAFDPACNLNAFLAANPQQQANLNLQQGAVGAAAVPASNGGGANPNNNNRNQQQQQQQQQQQINTQAQGQQGNSCAGTRGNLQQFPGALGGVAAPSVTQVGNQFQVQGNAALNTLGSALDRSCAVQHNQCANRANAGGNRNGLTVADCGRQQTQCNQFQNQN